MLLWITAAKRCAECMGVKSNKWSVRPIPILTHFLLLPPPLLLFLFRPYLIRQHARNAWMDRAPKDSVVARMPRFGGGEEGRTASNLITHYVARLRCARRMLKTAEGGEAVTRCLRSGTEKATGYARANALRWKIHILLLSVCSDIDRGWQFRTSKSR